MSKLKKITVKTGTVNESMVRIKAIMRAAEKGETIQASQTLVFEEPSEMLQFLSEKN